MKSFIKSVVIGWTLFGVAALTTPPANAFCGFFVARADTKLYNHASQVVLVRDGDRTVLTMVNDYQGDADEFAMVIPVPTVLEREQINVGDKAVVEHLDAYTAPRLVEYHDGDPCRRIMKRSLSMADRVAAPMAAGESAARAKSLGVSIEATYSVGEYDILILSAKQSSGLLVWLKENQYRLPDGAERVLGSYIKQGLKFFVAKVNLSEHSKLGFNYLRPIQIAYESPRFMLPIRLGMLNAKGEQELFVYALTRTGRIETVNYPTKRLPSGQEIPGFVKSDFANFYTSMFSHQHERAGRRAVFLEYAWDMAWCDPCAADPLSAQELRSLGVYWVNTRAQPRRTPAQNVFVTRLHVRYDAQHFPDDLRFQETGDRKNFQGRYVIRHPFKGEGANCAEADQYYSVELPERRRREVVNLSVLTGWEQRDIEAKLGAPIRPANVGPWWKRLWGDDG
ncbi:MAG: DUF2330 domain-containing protein [Pseudomonadota bacterium]